MAIGLVQMRALHGSVDQLTLSSVPVFEKAEEFERELKNLLLLLQRLDGVNELEKIKPYEDLIAKSVSVLKGDIQNLTHADGEIIHTRDMKNKLLLIEDVAQKVLSRKARILDHALVLNDLNADLDRRQVATRNILEQLSFDTSNRASAQFDVEPSNVDMSELHDNFHRELMVANTITSISLEIEASVEFTKSLRNVPNQSEFLAIENALLFKLRGVAGLLSRLDDSPMRIELAKQVIQMRNLMFDQGGILGIVEHLLEFDIAKDAEIMDLFGLIEAISNLSNQLTKAARAQVNVSTLTLDQTMGRMVLIFVVAAIFPLFTIVGAIVLIVEKQINRRMAKLTKAVLSIAQGETNYEVDVFGDDELGKMAEALEVFKLRAVELSRSNEELEKFAYVAAHDLRSPLRAIQDLATWILEDDETDFSLDARENLNLLQQRVERLNSLLTDLLEYSRVGKEDSSLKAVSFLGIVSDVAEMLGSADAFNIKFEGKSCNPLTHVTPLRTIILNLVNNAIKHHDRDFGEIKISATCNGGRVFCTVCDDGPGIDPRYHERIFGLFQTLRPRDEVEGSGLGLAIVQKILEQYRGTIQIQSDPAQGRGTTFTFDFPDQTSTEINIKAAA
jgi:signal transduction histidine kinase